MKYIVTCECLDTQCLSTFSTLIVAAVDITDSLFLFCDELPGFNSPPTALICRFTPFGWSFGLAEPAVATANAVAAAAELDLKQPKN